MMKIVFGTALIQEHIVIYAKITQIVNLKDLLKKKPNKGFFGVEECAYLSCSSLLYFMRFFALWYARSEATPQ